MRRRSFVPGLIASAGLAGSARALTPMQQAVLLGPPSGPSLDLNFLSGALNSRIAFTRASSGTYVDASGTMQTAASNAARFDYDPVSHAPRGLLIEEARTNAVRNSTMAGAVAGTPGTLPTNWTILTVPPGISQQIVGTGTESGIAFVDVRLSGTATGTNFPALCFETISGAAAAAGQTWTGTCYLRLVAGASIGAWTAFFRELSAGGALLAQSAGLGSLTPGAAGLATQRCIGTGTAGQATTAFLQPLIAATITNGQVVDCTLRIGAPQLELGAFATSYIPTTSAAATRAAEVATMPVSTWFNSTVGTLAIEAMLPSIADPVQHELAGFTDGTIANSWHLRDQANSPVMRVQTFSANAFTGLTDASGALTAGVIFRAVGTYNFPALAAAAGLNGAAAVGGTMTLAPVGLNTLVLGLVRQNTTNGYLRRVRYWPRLLASGELQTVTT